MFVSSKGMNVMCEIAKKLRAENDSLKKELAETELSLMLAESELEAKKTRIAQLEREVLECREQEARLLKRLTDTTIELDVANNRLSDYESSPRHVAWVPPGRYEVRHMGHVEASRLDD